MLVGEFDSSRKEGPVIPVLHKLGAAQCGDSDLKDLRFKGIVRVF